jgi:hypothetical protein
MDTANMQGGKVYLTSVESPRQTGHASRIARKLFPYKRWADASGSESERDWSDSDAPDIEPMSEKAMCALAAAIELATKGIKPETNDLATRAHWTNYERNCLHQSLVAAARWSTQPNTGSVYAKDCLSVTTNLTGTCSSCTALAKVPGLK